MAGHKKAQDRDTPQTLPSAWRPGDEALYDETDEVRSGVLVKGTLKGRVKLEAFRILRGRRAWYVKGTLPTPTGGALVFESDLRQVNGRKKVDAHFAVFIDRALAPGALQHGSHRVIDVRRLDGVQPALLTGIDNTQNDYLSWLEMAPRRVDDPVAARAAYMRPGSRKSG